MVTESKLNVVIFGRGYIGLQLLKQLSADNRINVSAFARADFDYHDPRVVERYYDLEGWPDVIINCAGFTGTPNVDQCEQAAFRQDCWNLNAQLPLQLATLCMSHAVKFIHISSGCIYNGYEKIFTEDDEPNFGVDNVDSSFYAKSKHQAELNLQAINYGTCLRIRMPFAGLVHSRNFLSKISKYSVLLNSENSLTCVEDFAQFVNSFIMSEHFRRIFDIYNVVNPGVVTNRYIKTVLQETNYSILAEAEMLANKMLIAHRSNCILSDRKIQEIGMQLPPVTASLDAAVHSLVLAGFKPVQ